MSFSPLSGKSASDSHVGIVRRINEDSFSCRDEIGLWSVADGMGGHEAGDMASQMVVAALQRVPSCQGMEELVTATREALNQANSDLLRLDGQYERVPGSTVVVLLVVDGQAAALWCGDSRIYRLRNGLLEQITRDHSHVQELVDQQLIRPEEAESHPMANVITRAVGTKEPLNLDTLYMDLIDGDRFLLCSDGLSRLLSSQEIQHIMQTREQEESVHSLIQTALARGAPDNVTVVSVQCEENDVDARTSVM